LCTDNGAMIALAAGMRLQAGLQDLQTAYTFDVKPRWPLDDISPGAAALSKSHPLLA
jgi:N6-L-threonylcarbamoyladenine synthase